MDALILVAIAVALFFTPARFRKIGFAIVGVLFTVVIAIVLLNRRPLTSAPPTTGQKRDAPMESRRFNFDKYEQEKKDREDPGAKTRIPLSEVRFDQIQAIAGVEPGTIESIHARLYNDSAEFTLTDYSSYLVVQDCLAAGSSAKSGESCTTVYDQHDSESLTVPPRQARDVVIPIPKNPPTFNAAFKLLGTPRIDVTATDTRAYQAAAESP